MKRAAIAGALTYGGGKLFGAGGASGTTASGALTPDKTGFAGSAPTTGSYSQVGLDQIAGGGLQPQYATDFSGLATAPSVGSVGAGSAEALLQPERFTNYQDFGMQTQPQPEFAVQDVVADQAALKAVQPKGIMSTIKDVGGSAIDRAGEAVRAGYDTFASLSPLQKGLAVAAGATFLSGLGGGQPIPQQQLAMAGLTPVETDFDKQQFTYRDREGNILTRDEALRMIQQASQNVGAGGQKQASGVTYGFDRVDDKILSASGGLIGMMYGGQAMPENNMDVKYKEFSGMVGGEGTGMEDNVYMPIVEGEQGQQVATLAVSPKEYVVDANTMSLLGNGNPDEGAEIMDQTVKDIRKKATGQTKQQKEIDGLAALNRMRRSV